MNISIVVINYGDKSYFWDLIESLRFIRTDFELIIGIIGNDDLEEVKDRKLPQKTKIIKINRNYGPPGNRNRLAAYAEGDYIMFLDNDVILSNSISRLTEYLNEETILQLTLIREDGRIDSAGGLVDELGYPYELYRDEKYVEIQSKKEILYAKGAGAVVPRNVFLKLGGFDEDFFYGYADTDLGLRAWKSGFKVVSVPIPAVHYEHGSFTKNEDKRKERLTYLLESRRLYFILKNFNTKFILRILPKILVYYYGSLVKDIVVRKEPKIFFARFRAGLWFIGKIPQLFLKRLRNKRNTIVLNEQDLFKMGLIIKR